MPIPLLPSLKEENKIAISKRGEWICNSQNTLPNLIDSLKVVADSDSRISSIPDVWARPALYEIILSNDKHPLHEKYKQEWRGILAILALRQLRGFDRIRIENVFIPELTKLEKDVPDFMKVIARSLPEEYKQQQEDQTLEAGQAAKIQIVVMNDKPLAILWPSILVCPSIGLENNRVISINWWKQDGLNNPIPDLSDDEKNALYKWLNAITDKVNNNMLMQLLVAFRDDIRNSLGDKFNINYPLGSIKPGCSLGITGACSAIDNPIIGVTDDSFLEKSNIHLIKQRNNDAKEFLILSNDIEKQWNMNASDIVVGGYVTVNAALPKATGVILDHQKVASVDLGPYNAEIHMANEFFADKMAIVFLGNTAFPNSINNKVLDYNGGKINFVLPIKKELLNYLTSEYIAQHVSVSVVNGGIEVILELPLSGINGEERSLVTKKLYKNDDVNGDIVVYDTVPLIQIWPNFIMDPADKWKAYYTYYDAGGNRTFYAEPYWENSEKRLIKTGMMNAEVRKGESFPEAFCCSAITKKSSGIEEAMELGILALKKPAAQIINSPNLFCKIGIDFGTTNTIAYMSLGSNAPTAMHFDDRMFYVTNNAQDGISPAGKQALRLHFLSPSEQPNGESTSIKTMFHPHLGNFDGNLYQPFFLGNIYYWDDSTNVIDDDDAVNDIQTGNMKWGDPAGAHNFQVFLMQLCTQCMAEAVRVGASSIEWSYSYPASFSIARVNMYQINWTGPIFKEIKKMTSVELISPSAHTESNSIAEYFVKDMGATIKQGLVCLDIGGGSTDMAIWQGNQSEIQQEGSLRFAGRNILNDYLWNKQKAGHSLFTQFKTGDIKFNIQLEKLAESPNQHKYDLQLEAILNYFEKTLFDELPAQINANDIKIMIRDIAFALSGIFFYAGDVIGYLCKNGDYDQEELLPKCYIGGNASKLLDWAAAGSFNQGSLIKNVFEDCFKKGVEQYISGVKYNNFFDVIKTKHPKQEVAYGLVSNAITPVKANHDGDMIVAGEEFKVQQDDTVKSDVLSKEDILKVVQIDRNCPPVFDEFLKTFNHRIKSLGYDQIQINEKDFRNICSSVNQNLVDKRNKAAGDVDEVELEPLFILLLKTVFEHLSKQ